MFASRSGINAPSHVEHTVVYDRLVVSKYTLYNVSKCSSLRVVGLARKSLVSSNVVSLNAP